MYMYRSFRKISTFLIAAAIIAVVWFQIGDCIAVEQESKVQKLKEEMRMPWSGANIRNKTMM